MFAAYGNSSSLECIALKAAMVMCVLLLQNPHKVAKTKDFTSSLERRLDLWRQGQIAELLNEGKVIQQCLSVSSCNTTGNNDRMVRRFVDHMLRGNVKAAIKVIDSANNSSTLLRLNMPVDMSSPSWIVYNEILKKHPPGQPAHPGALKPLSSGGSDFHPVIFDVLDRTVIRSVALRT